MTSSLVTGMDTSTPQISKPHGIGFQLRIRRLDGSIPAYSVDELHVEQVEMDSMGINAIVGDLPKLSGR